jgi:hypothetical protein
MMNVIELANQIDQLAKQKYTMRDLEVLLSRAFKEKEEELVRIERVLETVKEERDQATHSVFALKQDLAAMGQALINLQKGQS